MIYYRVAFQRNQEPIWKWQSTALTSLHALFGFLRIYGIIPHDRIRVFFSSSTDLLDEMLARENRGLASNSCTAEQLMNECRRIPVQEMHRLEVELGGRETPRVLSQAVRGHHPDQHQLVSEMICPAPECGSGGDHDLPYTFTPAVSQQQALAWIKLLARVYRGELQL